MYRYINDISYLPFLLSFFSLDIFSFYFFILPFRMKPEECFIMIWIASLLLQEALGLICYIII